MDLFQPRTLSTDWEVTVVDKLERCVNEDKLRGFAGLLRRECNVPVQIDWNALEFALGINRSFDQLWERIRTVTDRATQALREYDLDLFPAGAHPVEEMFDGAHVHVGTLHDEGAGMHLENHAEVRSRVRGARSEFAGFARPPGRVQELPGERPGVRLHGTSYGP